MPYWINKKQASTFDELKERKVCSKCKQEKEFNEFPKAKREKLGIASSCKTCKKKFRDENREKINKQKREHYWENKEYLSKVSKIYREKNKIKISNQRKDYRQKNKEKLKQQKHNYYLLHKQHIKDYQKRYFSNPINYRRNQEYKKVYRLKNKDKDYLKTFNSRPKKVLSEVYKVIPYQEIINLFNLYDYCCFYCNIKLDNNTRSIDHIIPLKHNGTHNIKNLVPCCRTCNSKKSAKFVIDFVYLNNISLSDKQIETLKIALEVQ